MWDRGDDDDDVEDKYGEFDGEEDEDNDVDDGCRGGDRPPDNNTGSGDLGSAVTMLGLSDSDDRRGESLRTPGIPKILH